MSLIRTVTRSGQSYKLNMVTNKLRHERMKEAKKNGRPTMWSENLEDEICRRIAAGRSVNSVSKDPDMPSDFTIWKWMNEKESFSQKYARAIAARAMAHADEISDLTKRVVSGEVPPDVARVALDGLKWTASRLLPKIYGDRQTVDVAVTHTHQLHLDALKRLNDTAKALPASDIIEGEIVSVS